ncbi:hypothetical protein I601_2270 [Nocardioides dokdonensis FR1436]|uniref:GmrSD restriction endonucleases N-terminal domain-containing protein n=1 Tax=Nocardioides dokdonensis FR1436 TaxID=1300347 RepID=A0A1A9GKA1_9ACTN|nr:DUF262 domain-containing protein [Nocardioides dokdonensis]ANH38694.1 hypothetical protein I601_2270 [Nocardioides dokdonensis FR1436]
MSIRESDEENMTGYRTTFQAMFGEQIDGMPSVERVAIPLIQRDYAQGRLDTRTSTIRATFLDALHAALTGETSVGLDFIYGEVHNDGTFEPLDGQQRLTTLFLLHWYLAFRRGEVSAAQPWTNFSYATRPSARLFCERLVKHPPPSDLSTPPSAWITDQSWYLHLWQFDPTIRAMLVTIDAIASRFADESPDELWQRLSDAENPAIWFQLLPIDDMGAAEDLYIKMNSRGKPLTEFEAFKAFLGQLVDEAGGFEDFGHKIDGDWTDVLWPYRGENNIVDDEFMRYFDFLMEVCEWREGWSRVDDLVTPEKRAKALYGLGNPRHREHLSFMHGAFETWVAEPNLRDYFESLFKTTLDGDGVRVFGANATSDLFHACCDRYGDLRGSTRLFSLTDTLLLLAVLVHRQHQTPDVAARLRSLRNVNEASQFEMRVTNMPKFVNEVTTFIQTGDFDALATFNTNQVNEEKAKQDLRTLNPELIPSIARLEDHAVLRGTLACFDLSSSISHRASAFEAAFEPTRWPLVTGTLLACGAYQRGYQNSDRFQFGSPNTDSVWRLVLVDRGDRDVLAPAREALAAMLDLIADADTQDVEIALGEIARDFTKSRADQERFDWRYHLVRYPEMREGNTGIYYGADGELGYEMTMLRKKVQRSYYRDAYLYAIWSEAGRPSEVSDPWFYGYSTTARWMELARSRVGIRSVSGGLALRNGDSASDEGTLKALCEAAGAEPCEDGWLLRTPQRSHAGELVDTVDRVQVGAEILRDLITAGL